jgi:hypothetical protein
VANAKKYLFCATFILSDNHVVYMDDQLIISCINIQIIWCSCPKNNKVLCPLSNKYITESVVYQATVTIKDKTTNRPPQTYVGLTENLFKTRLANHKAPFNSFDKRHATELTKYVWELKNRNIGCYIVSVKVQFSVCRLVKTVSRAGPQNVMFGNRSAIKHLLTGQ